MAELSESLSPPSVSTPPSETYAPPPLALTWPDLSDPLRSETWSGSSPLDASKRWQADYHLNGDPLHRRRTYAPLI